MAKESLLNKIEAYKKSTGLTLNDSKSISRKCRQMSDEMGISIEPKEYRMLNMIAEALKLNEKLDLTVIAKKAGYPEWRAKRPETEILRDIDPALFTRIVGINRNEIEMELVKVMKQDANLSAKNKALDLASRIAGMNEPDKGVQVNIVNDGITVAD